MEGPLARGLLLRQAGRALLPSQVRFSCADELKNLLTFDLRDKVLLPAALDAALSMLARPHELLTMVRAACPPVHDHAFPRAPNGKHAHGNVGRVRAAGELLSLSHDDKRSARAWQRLM